MPRSFLTEPVFGRLPAAPGFLPKFVGSWIDYGPRGYVEARTDAAALAEAQRMARRYPNARLGQHTRAWSWGLFWFVYRVDIYASYRDDC